jgi:hypothetical protein
MPSPKSSFASWKTNGTLTVPPSHLDDPRMTIVGRGSSLRNARARKRRHRSYRVDRDHADHLAEEVAATHGCSLDDDACICSHADGLLKTKERP